jgi:hypothetical protein
VGIGVSEDDIGVGEYVQGIRQGALYDGVAVGEREYVRVVVVFVFERSVLVCAGVLIPGHFLVFLSFHLVLPFFV